MLELVDVNVQSRVHLVKSLLFVRNLKALIKHEIITQYLMTCQNLETRKDQRELTFNKVRVAYQFGCHNNKFRRS